LFEQAVLRFDVACLSVEEWNAGARALYIRVGFEDSGGGVLVKTL
jgi:predicted GNAT family acetyltransferase